MDAKTLLLLMAAAKAAEKDKSPSDRVFETVEDLKKSLTKIPPTNDYTAKAIAHAHILSTLIRQSFFDGIKYHIEFLASVENAIRDVIVYAICLTARMLSFNDERYLPAFGEQLFAIFASHPPTTDGKALLLKSCTSPWIRPMVKSGYLATGGEVTLLELAALQGVGEKCVNAIIRLRTDWPDEACNKALAAFTKFPKLPASADLLQALWKPKAEYGDAVIWEALFHHRYAMIKVFFDRLEELPIEDRANLLNCMDGKPCCYGSLPEDYKCKMAGIEWRAFATEALLDRGIKESSIVDPQEMIKRLRVD